MLESDDVENFKWLCRQSSFADRDELLDGIEKGRFLPKAFEGVVPAKEMLDIYRRRVNTFQRKRRASEHAERMLRDMTAYLRELSRFPTDEIKLWSVDVDEASSYALFEGVKANRILGCIFGVDRRKVTEEFWRELWGLRD